MQIEDFSMTWKTIKNSSQTFTCKRKEVLSNLFSIKGKSTIIMKSPANKLLRNKSKNPATPLLLKCKNVTSRIPLIRSNIFYQF